MDKFRSWLTSEMVAEDDNSKSHDYIKRKSANARYEELQSGVRLLDEYAKHQESAHLRLRHRKPQP